MKEILKDGGKLFLKTIVVNIMCFFLVISFSVLTTAAFSKNIGYTAYGRRQKICLWGRRLYRIDCIDTFWYFKKRQNPIFDNFPIIQYFNSLCVYLSRYLA